MQFFRKHCLKYRNLMLFPGLEFFLENAQFPVEFRANRMKLFENCLFSQNFHTRKLG